MDADRMGRTLTRIAHEILERNAAPGDVDELALVGIRTRGVPLARRIAQIIRAITQHDVPTGMLDITLYRDDLGTRAGQPIVRSTEIAFPLKGLTIVLVDDVLFTGRTIRAAMDALMDLGRPRVIRLAVLAGQHAQQLHDELVAFSPADAGGSVRREMVLRGQERKEL